MYQIGSRHSLPIEEAPHNPILFTMNTRKLKILFEREGEGTHKSQTHLHLTSRGSIRYEPTNTKTNPQEKTNKKHHILTYRISYLRFVEGRHHLPGGHP